MACISVHASRWGPFDAHVATYLSTYAANAMPQLLEANHLHLKEPFEHLAGPSSNPTAQHTPLLGISDSEALSPEVSSRLTHSLASTACASPSTDADSCTDPGPSQLSGADSLSMRSQQIANDESEMSMPASQVDFGQDMSEESREAAQLAAQSPWNAEPVEDLASDMEPSPAGAASQGSLLDMIEPRLQATQNVRMSRGDLRGQHRADDPSWDLDEASSSGDHSSPHSGNNASAAVDCAESDNGNSHESKVVANTSSPHAHSTSSSDEWLQKQAGSSSTSSRHSSCHCSAVSHDSSCGTSKDSAGDSHDNVSCTGSHASEKMSHEPEEPCSTLQASADEGQTGTIASPDREVSNESGKEPSTGSAGVASLSAGIASQAASPSSASDADSNRAAIAEVEKGTGQDQQNMDNSAGGSALSKLPRSQFLDVEVGSLAGSWAQDAQTLGLGTVAMQADASSDNSCALAFAAASGPAAAAAAASSAAITPEPEMDQLTPGYKTGASSSFLQGDAASNGAEGSMESQATPQFNLAGNRVAPSEGDATPQLMLFGRPPQPPAQAPSVGPFQALMTAPSLESDAATPPPRMTPQPIPILQAVTSGVQVPLRPDQGATGKTVQPSRPAANQIGAQDASGIASTGDLMSPPLMCTPVMPRGQLPGKTKAASKRAPAPATEPIASEPNTASIQSQRPAAWVGEVAAASVPRPTNVFLTTPPPPTAPKVSSRTRKRSPKPASSSIPAPTGSAMAGPTAAGESLSWIISVSITSTAKEMFVVLSANCYLKCR